MRHTGILSCIVVAGMLQLGCGDSSSKDPNRSDANRKVREAEHSTSDAIKAKRIEYANDMQKSLDALDVKYKALEVRASEAKGDSKKVLEEMVKDAKVKRDIVAKKLVELGSATEDRWDKIKDGLAKDFESLKKVFD